MFLSLHALKSRSDPVYLKEPLRVKMLSCSVGAQNAFGVLADETDSIIFHCYNEDLIEKMREDNDYLVSFAYYTGTAKSTLSLGPTAHLSRWFINPVVIPNHVSDAAPTTGAVKLSATGQMYQISEAILQKNEIVAIKGRIVKVDLLKEFGKPRNGEVGFVRNIAVKDSSGCSNVALFHSKAKLPIEKSDYVQITGLTVGEFNKNASLQSTSMTTIEHVNWPEEESISEDEEEEVTTVSTIVIAAVIQVVTWIGCPTSTCYRKKLDPSLDCRSAEDILKCSRCHKTFPVTTDTLGARATVGFMIGKTYKEVSVFHKELAVLVTMQPAETKRSIERKLEAKIGNSVQGTIKNGVLHLEPRSSL